MNFSQHKLITKYLYISFLAFICFSFTGFRNNLEKPPQKLDIFLLIGQSNMVGVATIKALDTITLQNVYLFNDKQEWELAKNTDKEGFNRYSTVRNKSYQKLSPGYTFARKLAAYTGREIGIVSNAKGGTTISWWQKGYTGEKDSDLYEEAVRRAKAALAKTRGAKIKGIIWHQGEGDNSKVSSAKYMERLKKLVQDLRTDLGDQEIPFIAGEVGKWKNRGLRVNPVIRQVKDSIRNADWVSSDGLSSLNLEKNDPHFDTFDQRVFGERYADKALELIYKISAAGVTLFTQPNYEGRSVVLKQGKYTSTDLESMGIGKGEITSLKIIKGYKVLLFPEDFNSKPYKLSKSNQNLNTKRFSSIQIISKNKNR